MRLSWTVMGLVAMGLFLTNAVLAAGPELARGDWYTVVFLVLAALAGLATWAGWQDVRESPQIFGVVAIFLGLFSAGPLELGVTQGAIALTIFVVSIIAWIRQPSAPLSADPRGHPFLSPQVLTWFWTGVATGLTTFFVLDAGSLALQNHNVKAPANLIVAVLFVVLTSVSLVLAWRRVRNVAVVFAVLSLLCALFAVNLGPYYLENLMKWQSIGGGALFILSLFGAVTAPRKSQSFASADS